MITKKHYKNIYNIYDILKNLKTFDYIQVFICFQTISLLVIKNFLKFKKDSINNAWVLYIYFITGQNLEL